MSGDKDMSTLARLEGIQTIYPEIPKFKTPPMAFILSAIPLNQSLHSVFNSPFPVGFSPCL